MRLGDRQAPPVNMLHGHTGNSITAGPGYLRPYFHRLCGDGGVCLVIEIIHVVISMQKINTLADDLLAVDAFVFLSACLRTGPCGHAVRRMHQVERCADAIFPVGLLLMVLVCGLIVYAWRTRRCLVLFC